MEDTKIAHNVCQGKILNGRTPILCRVILLASTYFPISLFTWTFALFYPDIASSLGNCAQNESISDALLLFLGKA